jgi:hypothetical protein
MIEICFFDVGLVSVFAARDAASNWGVERNGWTSEVWAGRTYVCASFSRRHVRQTARVFVIATLAFTLGWLVDPPDLTASVGFVEQDYPTPHSFFW